MRWIVFLVGLLVAVPAAAQPKLLQAHASGGCAPVSPPTGGYYSSTGLADSWTPGAATLTTGTIASPDCATNGAGLTESATNAQHQTNKTVTATITAKATTLTLYAKRTVGTRNIAPTLFSSSFGSSAAAGFDLGTCTVNVAATVTGSWTLPGATATIVGSWCKVTLTSTVILDTSINIYLFMEISNSLSAAYLGDGTTSIGLWGVNLQ